MTLNGITAEMPDRSGAYSDYIDLVHFSPEVGTVLTGAMLGTVKSDADLTDDPNAEDRITGLLQDDAAWRSKKRYGRAAA